MSQDEDNRFTVEFRSVELSPALANATTVAQANVTASAPPVSPATRQISFGVTPPPSAGEFSSSSPSRFNLFGGGQRQLRPTLVKAVQPLQPKWMKRKIEENVK